MARQVLVEQQTGRARGGARYLAGKYRASRARRNPAPPWQSAVDDRDRGAGARLVEILSLDRPGGSLEAAGPAGHLAVAERAGLEADGARAVQEAAAGGDRDVYG